MKYKKRLIILLISVFIYIIFNILYNKLVVSSDYKKVWILTKNIEKGNEITINDLKQITLKGDNYIEEYITDVSVLSNKVSNYNLYKNQLVTNDILVDKDKYITTSENKEVISIKVKTPEDGAAYNINKDDRVNIYYTGKTDYATSVLEEFEGSNIVSGGNPGYISVMLFKNIDVIGVYDKYGNEINNNQVQENEIVMDTILISVDNKMAMIVSNLQRYGDFTLSLVN